ncbi:unnamed protein product [Lymnaea stagnalis]|uniref:Uncharacterized protein n=1 Tax=Lymnaea stagnalis TaxID=6523 RepID=A0AAV2HX74_LYMST
MSGQETHWHDMDTVCKRAKFLADEVPDKELFVFYDGDRRDAYTARELYTLAGRFANRLRQQGFERQDVIANTLANSPERVITDLGIMLAGCVTMNGQLLMADGSDFFRSAKNSRCRGIVMAVGESSAGWQLLGKYITVNNSQYVGDVLIKQAPEVKAAILVHREKDSQKKPFIDDLKTCGADIYDDKSIAPEDFGMVKTTSGSTGYSKLVPRTHKEIVTAMDLINSRRQWTHPRDNRSKIYSERLLGWAVGMTAKTFCMAETRVLSDKMSSPGPLSGAAIWRLVVAEGCNNCSLTLQDYESIYNHVTGTGGPKHRLDDVELAGQPVTEAQVKKTLTLSKAVTVAYGSTETYLIAEKRLHDSDDSYSSNNSGQPIAGTTVRVVDDKGEICKPGVTGTIHVTGPLVFKGYFNRLEDPDPQTKLAFTSDGWVNTNDYGYVDDSGDLFVLGRNNDIIVHGNYLFYPSWMENRLMEHPDILVACLVPVSDPVVYQNICACLKLVSGSELTEEKIKAYCQSTFLPSVSTVMTHMPDFYILFNDEFPETATGKPDKVTLRKMAEDKFGYIGRSKKVSSAVAWKGGCVIGGL